MFNYFEGLSLSKLQIGYVDLLVAWLLFFQWRRWGGGGGVSGEPGDAGDVGGAACAPAHQGGAGSSL